MALRIKDYKARDGSRFSLLMDTEGDGFPLYFPTAYISMRLASLTANTQRVNLYCLKKLYDWANEKKIDLDHRFATKKLLTVPEVESLVQSLSTNTKELDGTRIKGARVSYYLDILIDYLGWLFGHWIKDSNSEENRFLIERLQANLAERKPKSGSKSQAKRRRIAKKLTDEADTALLELFESFDDKNPENPKKENLEYGTSKIEPVSNFKHGLAFRNALALRILYDIGIRLGELLSLRYSDFIPASAGEHAYIRIERNHDDEFDRRINQPVAKTLGRTLPISEQLEQMMFTYLGTYRAEIPNVGFDDGSFIFVNHKGGRNQGREIEIATFRSALAVIISRDKRLKGLHPHLLRHHWNYRFSQDCIKRGLSDQKAREEREHWMGWVAGSQSALDYDLRSIQQSANEHGRAIASDTARNKSDRKRPTNNRNGIGD
ncbi:site-specific integrase [Pseudomonas sp. B21-015]|uniref:site-specific integrase n=1 Tax=Pseudomonas sp. B21-015 TaxID=2895473 RepID=UPI00215E36D1|nr:site-specific integrase [Pseudomonas sp. B21-015]UVM53154.1 site-specific integrase [Pseudomonas sp. B21-015]